MVLDAFDLLTQVFTACVQWVSFLFNSVDGYGFVISGLIITFVTTLFLLPFRGSHAVSNINTFSSNAISKTSRKSTKK